MGLIFKVGEHEDFPPAPANFPKCGNWLPPLEEDENNDVFETTEKEKTPVVIQDLPYNVTDPTKRTERPSVANGDESFGTSSGDSGLTSDFPITLSDEDNFVVPQRLTNGTLSHSESHISHTASGSHQYGSSYIWSVVLPICFIVVR